jgi:serine/threonine protein phosphatase 1
MESRLSNALAAQHRRIDPGRWSDVYVVGDVHGCPDALDALVNEAGIGDDDLLVFVGDLVRKGPDSAGVVARVREAENALSVRGNNEEKLLRGEKALPELDGTEMRWLRSLPVAISWATGPGYGAGLVVHGGVDPRMPLGDHTVDDLQTARCLDPGGGYEGPFWYDSYEGPPRVFFGHTVLSDPLLHEWAVGLDTGYVYGGALTAYRLGDGTVHQVEPDRTEVERADAKVVSTGPGGADD